MFIVPKSPLLSLPVEQLPEEDDPSQCNLKIIFQNILANNSKIPFFKSVEQLEIKISSNLTSIRSKKLISKKMRTKLLDWMEKLAIETFGFSAKTWILATKILDHYLSLSNQSPSVLQLIGCTCLFLAAKTYQPTVVACQCYVVASANTFTEQLLFDKELEIYKTIGYNTNFVCPLRVYKSLTLNFNYTITKNCTTKDLERLFFDIVKNIEISQFGTIKIVSMILSFSEVFEKLPTSNQILENLKLINF